MGVSNLKRKEIFPPNATNDLYFRLTLYKKMKRYNTLHHAIFAACCTLLVWTSTNTLRANESCRLPQTDTVKIVTAPVVDYTRPIYKEIAGIEITGAQGIDQTLLLNIAGLSIGELVEVPGAVFSDAVRRFMRNGYFANAQIYATKYEGNKVWIRIHLTQHPRISQVTITGAKKSEKEDIEKNMAPRQGTQLTPNIEDRTKQLITKYYNQKGYSEMSVEIKSEPDITKENFVNVHISIDRKDKTKIANITFEGNNNLSAATLKAAMKKTNEVFRLSGDRWLTSIKELFSTKKFVQELYEEDLNNLISAYHNHGYRDAEIVSSSISQDPENANRINIHIKVNEGTCYRIKNIRIVGNTKYPSDLLQHVLNVRPGDVYDQGKLNDRLFVDEDAVANLYYNNGYLFAGIDPVETAVTGDSVSLDLRITEGPQATIDKVIINGNTQLYEEVIRRELHTKPGKLFSREDLMNSWMALNQLGHFDPEKSTPTPIPNQQSGTVDIEYNLTPRNNDKFEASIGFSQAGFIGRVGINLTNFSISNLFNPNGKRSFLPQGEGQQLSISAMSNGRYYQQYNIQFSDPWFGGKRPNYFSVSAFYSMQTALDTRYYNNQIGSYAGYGYGYGYDRYGYGGYGRYGYNNGYGGYGYGGQDLMEKSYNPNQSLHIAGTSVGFGKRLNWPDNWFMFYTSLNYTFYYLRDWVYDTFEGFHNGMANDINLNLRLSRNSIDNPVFTRRGSDFSLSVTATLPYSLWDGVNYADPNLNAARRNRFVEYHKWRFSGKVFSPLLNPATVKYTPVFMNRFDMGFIGSYNSNKRTPFGNYYMGGDGMSGYVGGYMSETIPLRGYRSGSIAGNNYNYAYAFLRLVSELRIPVLFQSQYNAWILLFAEAGNAWRNVEDFNAFNLKRSAGVGFRITLPYLGLLGLDWGYGFDKPDGSSSRGGSNISFVLGQEF